MASHASPEAEKQLQTNTTATTVAIMVQNVAGAKTLFLPGTFS